MVAKMTTPPTRVQIQVAVSVPMRQVFDYWSPQPLAPGCRVFVPFGKTRERQLLGLVVAGRPTAKAVSLKWITRVIDPTPLIGPTLLDLLTWSARYYHHPLGEVIHAALPKHLRAGKPDHELPARIAGTTRYRRVASDAVMEADASLRRAPKQKLLLAQLPHDAPMTHADLIAALPKNSTNTKYPAPAKLNPTPLLNALCKKGLIVRCSTPEPQSQTVPTPFTGTLTSPQTEAIAAVTQALGTFVPFVLHGITGSGKTEVYLHIMQQCLAHDMQAMILVPEIALTPQLVARVTARLGDCLCVVHSGMSESARYRAWWQARAGRAKVLLGARSMVFTPCARLAVIIVDEEHDSSYKQHERFRYHARDLAVKRASIEHIPIILGSATPSMEAMNHVRAKHYHLLQLTERAGHAQLPRIELVDTTQHRPENGLSPPLITAIAARLTAHQQVILYINRRGFAPLVCCWQCDWRAQCDRCDAYLTYHRQTATMRCHHCGKTRPARQHCPKCQHPLAFAGVGTQRLEQALRDRFPAAKLLRFDRDQLTTHDQLQQGLAQINAGEVDIIIGTQLISKGHDFPRVTLVGIIHADQGLYSSDFRATEYLFQQLVQVSGRAGRGTQAGTVLIQTAQPQNPTLQLIRAHDSTRFYQHCMTERQQFAFPPFGYMVLWRAEAVQDTAALSFLQHVRTIGLRLATLDGATVQIMDAIASPMAKRAGRYRAQLLVKAATRPPLHALLREWVAAVDTMRAQRAVRWSLDIDPMELY